MRNPLFFAVLVLCLSSTLSSAQDGFPADWFNMVSATQAAQPHWITPLATTTARLEQEFRYDIQWQTHNSGVTTDNYGVSKGLEIIPAKNFEVIFAVPPYIVNNPDSSHDGFGDWGSKLSGMPPAIHIRIIFPRPDQHRTGLFQHGIHSRQDIRPT
jgi:hypothetical protein